MRSVRFSHWTCSLQEIGSTEIARIGWEKYPLAACYDGRGDCRRYQGRLLKEIMSEAMKLGSRVKWVKDLRMGLDAFGWQGLDMQALSGLSMNEVKHILKCMAWRRARGGWREETRARPRLEVMGRLRSCECKARCVETDCKRQRRMLMKLRGRTAELRIETGR